MNRRTWTAAVVAGALVTVAAAGCGVTTDPKARAIAREDVRFNLADTTTTTTTLPTTTTLAPSSTSTTLAPATTTTAPTELVRLYFVRNGKLTTEMRSLTVAAGARASEEAILDQLVVGPTTAGSETFVVSQVLSALIEVVAGTARVELGPAYFALPPEQQVLALGQVVRTLTERPGIGRVIFRQAGDQSADIWKGDTSITSSEVSADDYKVLLG